MGARARVEAGLAVPPISTSNQERRARESKFDRFERLEASTYRAAQALAAALLPRTTRAGAWVIAKAMAEEVEREAGGGRRMSSVKNKRQE